MKVFNLVCAHDHHFEGWFRSSEDHDQQHADGLLECPLCGDRDIRKLPSAPRLNLSGANPPSAMPATKDAGGASVAPAASTQGDLSPRALQALWLRMARELQANTEDVGDRFAQEARRIHFEEAPARAIRGTASAEEARELQSEGIEVFSFPMPKGSTEPLQ